MILKGNARGGAKDLALHLMKDENEHVEVHELRGFASGNLMGALNEAYAVSRGTKCRQFLYSLSLNPPLKENVGAEDFEVAIERIEEKLGLAGQPRAIVFHEKEGPKGVRRHAHAVWSRIDTENMKAVQLSYDHKKLNAVSRELFLEHGWKMPRGLANTQERDPKNFTLAEWQQARRTGQDPHDIKTAIQDAWAISDSKAAFTHAMQERGLKIARGDRRGFVAVDVHGEVYSIPHQAGVKTKDVRQRLGDEGEFCSVADAKLHAADEMLPKLDDFQKTLEAENQKRRSKFDNHRKNLVQRQRAERQAFKERLEARQITEANQRQERFRTGFKGLWDRMRGEHKRVTQKNQNDAERCAIRDRSEKDKFVFNQVGQRRMLNMRSLQLSQQNIKQWREIKTDRSQYQEMKKTALQEKRDEFMRARKGAATRKRVRSRVPTPER